MSNILVQNIPANLYEVLGITDRQRHRPYLIDAVIPVVVVAEEDTTSDTVFIGRQGTSVMANSGTGVGPSVGNLSVIQLFNPVGSGVRFELDAFTFWENALGGQIVDIAVDNVALGTLVANAVKVITPATDPLTASVMELRSATPAALAGDVYKRIRVTGAEFDRVLANPLHLNPGTGVSFASTTANIMVFLTAAGRTIAL